MLLVTFSVSSWLLGKWRTFRGAGIEMFGFRTVCPTQIRRHTTRATRLGVSRGWHEPCHEAAHFHDSVGPLDVRVPCA